MKKAFVAITCAVILLSAGFVAGWHFTHRFTIAATWSDAGGYVVLDRSTGKSQLYMLNEMLPRATRPWDREADPYWFLKTPQDVEPTIPADIRDEKPDVEKQAEDETARKKWMQEMEEWIKPARNKFDNK